MFAYNQKATLFSYQPKNNKNVILLSTMQETGTINQTTRKPEIIHTDLMYALPGYLEDICDKKTRKRTTLVYIVYPLEQCF